MDSPTMLELDTVGGIFLNVWDAGLTNVSPTVSDLGSIP